MKWQHNFRINGKLFECEIRYKKSEAIFYLILPVELTKLDGHKDLEGFMESSYKYSIHRGGDDDLAVFGRTEGELKDKLELIVSTYEKSDMKEEPVIFVNWVLGERDDNTVIHEMKFGFFRGNRMTLGESVTYTRRWSDTNYSDMSSYEGGTYIILPYTDESWEYLSEFSKQLGEFIDRLSEFFFGSGEILTKLIQKRVVMITKGDGMLEEVGRG